ncbi:MAG TPA: hypothetical protein VNH80_00550, partial [Burkholderiales bacterium]|nr:hypothetical protein [Burkholderiales bacterium]
MDVFDIFLLEAILNGLLLGGLLALLGVVLHQFVIKPVLSAEPINQLLVTGGALFFLQAAATLAFGI